MKSSPGLSRSKSAKCSRRLSKSARASRVGPAAGASALVDLAEQQVYLYDADGAVTHQFSVSSGRDGLTPVL